MGAVAVIVAIWMLVIVFERQTHVQLGLGSMALGYVLAWYVPIWFKHRHVKSQNRLLDRCRALLILGSRAIDAGDRTAAEQALLRIRRLERLWKLGNAVLFRTCLAVWAIAWGVAASMAIRFAGLLVVHYGWTDKLLAADKVLSELWLAAMISATAPLYALMGYFEAWVNPWAIEDSGDRLWQLIHGGRNVEILPPKGKRNSVPTFDGMTAREVFGLARSFKRRDLDKARRDLVRELHPDRWHAADARERHAREESLKRVNAAYDELCAELS